MVADFEGQYADITQFVCNWGQYVLNMVRVECGLQQHAYGEQVAQTILQQMDKLYSLTATTESRKLHVF
jgi:hypothetical protein